jgi:hypothetical protein
VRKYAPDYCFANVEKKGLFNTGTPLLSHPLKEFKNAFTASKKQTR